MKPHLRLICTFVLFVLLWPSMTGLTPRMAGLSPAGVASAGGQGPLDPCGLAFGGGQGAPPNETEAGALDWTTIPVLVDDFVPQPLQGDPRWVQNRLGGTRGDVVGYWDGSNARSGGGTVQWGRGVVTATITTNAGEAWTGAWTSLNHPLAEHLGLDFAAPLPAQIHSWYQPAVRSARVHVRAGRGRLRLELQAPDGTFVATSEQVLTGGEQTVVVTPTGPAAVANVNWTVIGRAGDWVAVDRVELVVDVPYMCSAGRGLLWSYGMLLANWNPATGLTRDRAGWEAGAYDNVAASGLQAAAAVFAAQFGFIAHEAAVQIVDQTTASLLALPRHHGLWPRFVQQGQAHPQAEWSSVDTAVAAIALIEARQALGLDTGPVEAVLTGIDWSRLILPNGSLSHGYAPGTDTPLPTGWSDFGSESWLVNWAYAAATGHVASFNHTPPTHNGSGFVDELAWLFAPAPQADRFGTPWTAYLTQAAAAQRAYYHADACYGPRGLFGLSAAEVPAPDAVLKGQVYQAFGVGGNTPANDGTALLGRPVVVPHYAALASRHEPDAAAAVWDWLLAQHLFTPLNNAESLMLGGSGCSQITWNSLRGSWNLGLQALGWAGGLWGGENPLHAAATRNGLLQRGYAYMTTAQAEPFKAYLSLVKVRRAP